jgi:transposase
MMGLAPLGRIFLRRQPTDMRKSFDGLSGIVRGELGHDPLAGDLFVFVNRRRDFVKALYWDRDGLALWAKRLARGRFAPRPDGPSEIGRDELALLLEGVRARVVSRSPRWQPVNRMLTKSP